MKVLLIGEIFSENLGDQLIYSTTKMLLKEKYPNCELKNLDIMGRENNLKKNNHRNSNNIKMKKFKKTIQSTYVGDYIIKLLSAKKTRKYYKEIINSQIDIAVFVGGQVISDTFGTYLHEIVKLLHKNNIPIVFHAVGFGEFKSTFQRKKFINIFRKDNIAGISSRFNVSNFNEVVLKNSELQADYTLDPGIFASELYNVIKDNTTNCIGLGIMKSSRFKEEVIIQFWTRVINILNNKNLKWKMFTTGQTSDYKLAKKILENIKYSEENFGKHLADNPISVSELVSTIGSFERILSFRLHSHIIAYSLNIPSVAIVWDNKITDFMTSINNVDSSFKINDDTNRIIKVLLEKSTSISYKLDIEKNKEIVKSNLYNLIEKAI